jgi:hypothetical protein
MGTADHHALLELPALSQLKKLQTSDTPQDLQAAHAGQFRAQARLRAEVASQAILLKKSCSRYLDDVPGNDPGQGAAAVRLRALAHPLRWKLLDAVFLEGTATATRCAELTGESVASCSYHLSILGKYSYLERVPGPGKEKPWRAAGLRQDLAAPGPDLEDQLASEAATEAFAEHEFARLRAWRRRLAAEPADWQEASGLGGSTMWVSAAELEQIQDEMLAILNRYTERSEDPPLRPAAARASRVFFFTAVSPR